MQIIAEIFYLQVYISVIGALFTAATLFASRVLRLTVPLWFALCGLAVYVLPFLAPDVQPVSPEGQLCGRMAFIWLPASGARAV